MVHSPGKQIPEHRHDWPNLTIHELGACDERFDGGECRISGPAVILHPAGCSHADSVHSTGLVTTGILFDPDWLKHAGLQATFDGPICWIGGRASAAARHLAREWRSGSASEDTLARATARFLNCATAEQLPARPHWFDKARTALSLDVPPTTASLAKDLGLNPAWLARAYRAAVGEGVQDTLRRKRVERALSLLRETRVALAEVAAMSGFSDQSHMTRDLRALIGQTPVEVRLEWSVQQASTGGSACLGRSQKGAAGDSAAAMDTCLCSEAIGG